MHILQLNTGLFPDAQTVTAALRQMADTHPVSVVDLTRRDLRESDWDAAMEAMLAADRIISI
ncbi:MAG: hypothetical protein RBS28_02330 [Rhodocyclaceae bacterium]|jgi:hypothetical protein|nr:hypothetical protein [Rhodocyclaceae bacterium]